MKVTLLTCRRCSGTKLETEVERRDDECLMYWWCTRCSLCLLSLSVPDARVGWERRVSVSLTAKER